MFMTANDGVETISGGNGVINRWLYRKLYSELIDSSFRTS